MQWAERCFNSLRTSSVKPNVFVVDNGSTDGTQAYIHEHYPEVLFQQSKENLGFGKANNIGLQYALDNGYDYAYLLNQDAWVMTDTFEKLIEISQKHPEYGILSPFQMNADLKCIDKNFLKRSCSLNSNQDLFNDIYNRRTKEVYPVPFVMAAHWLMTIDCIKKTGGFSPSFPHYGEDNNYISRVQYHEFKVGVVPELRVVHDRGTREKSKTKSMYLSYITFIIWLSNPQINPLKAFCKIIPISLRNVLYYKSFQPIGYLIRLIINSRIIAKNKQKSLQETCSFLHLAEED